MTRLWPIRPTRRVPPPDLTDPDTYQDWALGGTIEGSIIVDQESLFTTATALAALGKVVPVLHADGTVHGVRWQP